MRLLFLLLASYVFQPVRIKYDGGGDWYNDPEILANLSSELRHRIPFIKTKQEELVLTLDSKEIFKYPFLFITGHGNIHLSDEEIENLRKYLMNGGFVYIDDDFGMDEFFRKEIKRWLPEYELKEVPLEHPIYNLVYSFPKGVPKIHEHYEGAPKALGIFIGGRLSLLYTYNSNISDGWTDRYNDPDSLRELAIEFGVNLVLYSLLY
ncbi:MAG TPA: DUF4159 domain-containing protein [Candidatus Hydrothermia bacterium]|nr:DUF4159 domain-containing protein [Candidatus Hydrothermia bacterium]HOK22785.1 DUF4159 domain-containing protein [Candidatus Hydrothermia bacterium]HOL23494.1 DUF4159 domain-containing protein [Candidatus Hydrothermia bacterium]HPO78501.1 DUF4159 domain-containing protein [Candidatus Hydrothermia bacterium]HRD22838.1 DUF4159 domain-containing protein [Candidatus Hydrothermia bacterium]